jgi:hypothetical protein
MKKYILKEGVILYPFGASCPVTNENLTDSIAETLISKGLSLDNFENQEEKQTTKKIK